ncbi:hypothetical protein NF27_GJ00050, partial [Candidatus Jidaibacter acanthamoeba]
MYSLNGSIVIKGTKGTFGGHLFQKAKTDITHQAVNYHYFITNVPAQFNQWGYTHHSYGLYQVVNGELDFNVNNDFVRVTESNSINDIGVNIKINNGSMLSKSGAYIIKQPLKNVIHTLPYLSGSNCPPYIVPKNIGYQCDITSTYYNSLERRLTTFGGKYYINGNEYETAKLDIISEGITEHINGIIKKVAGRDIIERTLHTIAVVKNIKGKDYRSKHHEIYADKNEVFATNQVIYQAGRDYKGYGNTIFSIRGVNITAEGNIEIQATTSQATNEDYKKKKNTFGSKSVHKFQTVSETSEAYIGSSGEVNLNSKGLCRFEGSSVNAAGKVTIKCKGGAEFLAHQVKNEVHIYVKSRGISPTGTLVDLVKSDDPAGTLLDNIGIVKGIKDLLNMQSPTDLAPFMKLGAEVYGLSKKYQLFTSSNGANPFYKLNGTPLDVKAGLVAAILDSVINIGIKIGTSKSEDHIVQITNHPTVFRGEDLEMEIGGDAKFRGAQFEFENEVNATIKGKAEFESVKNEFHHDHSSEESGVSVSVGFSGINVGVYASESEGKREKVEHVASSIKGKLVNLVVGEDLS